jgi:predicted DNA-binding transcriptional regulator YafY
VKAANAASRLMTLVMMLQRQPNQKAASLARDLGISVRTLHRYITMLDGMGIPVYSERGPLGGFSLVRGYRMPPLIFTPEEAAAVSLGAGLVREMWGNLYAEAAQAALIKIENVLPDDQREEVAWSRRSLVSAGLRRELLDEHSATLEILRDALRERRRVRILYQGGAQSQAQERDFSPYVLAHSQGWWYAVGFCHLRDAIRVFRIDRIQHAELLEDRAEIPADFDPRPYLRMEWGGAKQIRVRLRFDKDFVHLISLGRSIWESDEPQPDGSRVVAFSVANPEWAASFVLSFGPAATVEEPESVRQVVAKWAEEVAGRYRTAAS